VIAASGSVLRVASTTAAARIPSSRAGVAAGLLAIHGWIYDMETGELSAYDPHTGDWRGLLDLA
jgi:carbonic anhydrase